MRDDYFTNTEADAGAYERQRAMGDYDPPDVEHDEEDATLTEFLLARIADDEEVARRAAFGYGAAWRSVTDEAEGYSAIHADSPLDMVGCEDADVTRHIARHDPGRILAECHAKERIVAAHRKQVVDDDDRAWIVASEVVLRSLAIPYSDHPDYDPGWRP